MTKKINYLSRKTRESLINYFKKIIEIIKKPEMGVLPGQLAFFILLSIVPIFTFVGYGAGIFNINMDTLLKFLDGVIPGGASNIIPYLMGNTFDFKLALLSIWMLYLAGNGFNSVILISNQIYGLNQSNWLKRRIKATFMTVGTVIMLILMLIIPVFGSKLLNAISSLVIYETIKKIYGMLKVPFMILILFLFIRMLYGVSPDRVRKHSHLASGSIFTTIGWTFVTWIYSLIANNMTTYNIFYGALANVAFLMIWLYAISLIFVVGMSLNYGREIEEQVMEETGAVKIVKKH